jgi:hypothetical protein
VATLSGRLARNRYQLRTAPRLRVVGHPVRYGMNPPDNCLHGLRRINELTVAVNHRSGFASFLVLKGDEKAKLPLRLRSHAWEADALPTELTPPSCEQAIV